VASLAISLLSVGGGAISASAQDMAADRAAASHPYAVHVAEAARRFGIPEAWIWAVMRVESNGDSRAVSRAGAVGLMQIMPATWAGLRARYGLGPDPLDVRDNIMAGAAYLREMHDRYGNVTAMLAAYNAGPGRYDDYLSRGRPLPPETVGYLAQLAPSVGTAGATGAAEVAVSAPSDHFAWRRAALFVRTSRAASDAVTVQPGDPLDATASSSDQIAAGAENARTSSAETHADTLFVPPRSRGPTTMNRRQCRSWVPVLSPAEEESIRPVVARQAASR